MLRRKVLFILLAIAVASCVTGQVDREKYVRDDVQYGVTKGRFRGRWWNYYERGRSFLDGGFWEEAEQDLRVALGGRSRDQFWPRTYGLHFVPEYFPHRELGVVLYRQGRPSESIAELETSLEQQFSARAAYYLDEARTELIESTNADTAPPEIEIISPESASPVAAIKTELVGVARDDTFVKRITIDGSPYLVEVSAREIPFSRAITLLPSDNEIEVAVEDLTGKITTKVVRIESDVDGPALSFDTPVEVPGSVTGVAFDPAGVGSVRIAGKPAALSPDEDGLVKFSLDLTRDELTPPLQYESEDAYGNTTRGRLPLDTLVVAASLPQVVFASGRPTLFPVSGNLRALVLGGEVLALTTAAAPEDTPQREPAVRFANLLDNQRYLMESIYVGVDVLAANPIDKVELGGIGLNTIPGRKTAYIGRQIPLEVGENIVLASAQDVAGQVGQASVTVERQETQVEQVGKLNVAMLGNIWKGNSPALEGEIDFIMNRLPREIEYHRRFGQIVDRSLLPEVLAEQELNAALGSRDERLALRQIIPAEVMFIGRARRDSETIEIVLEGFSSETAQRVALADVAGPANDTDQLELLVRDLALRVVQEFPRVQGNVALVRSANTFVTNLGEAHRLRESLKYVVFRYGEEILDPVTNESLGRDTEILCDALVQSVAERTSTAQANEEDLEGRTIERGDLVVTK